MAEDRLLRWVMANRAPRRAIGPIGEALGGIIDRVVRDNREQQSRLASLLADFGDHEFRRHCRIGELHEGVLNIEVDQPGLISIMRTRWTSDIEAALSRKGAKTRVSRVLFKFGRGGKRIPLLVPDSDRGLAGSMSDTHG